MCYNGGQVVVGGWMGLYSKNTIALLLMVACLGTRGIIISGGKETGGATTPRTSVELLYGNGSSCWLPDLPEGRWSHSQSGLVICGGGYKRTLLFFFIERKFKDLALICALSPVYKKLSAAAPPWWLGCGPPPTSSRC